jgi:hypothetical protein
MSVAVTGATVVLTWGWFGGFTAGLVWGYKPGLLEDVDPSTETPSLVHAFEGADTIAYLAGVVNAVSQQYAEVNVEGTAPR